METAEFGRHGTAARDRRDFPSAQGDDHACCMTGFAGKREPGRDPIFNSESRDPGVMLAIASPGIIAASDRRGFRDDQDPRPRKRRTKRSRLRPIPDGRVRWRATIRLTGNSGIRWRQRASIAGRPALRATREPGERNASRHFEPRPRRPAFARASGAIRTEPRLRGAERGARGQGSAAGSSKAKRTLSLADLAGRRS